MKIQEIAALAGVSTATVSRVFSHHPNIREEVREHVLAVARKHNYHPRLSAKPKNIVIIRPYEQIYPAAEFVEMVTSELIRELALNNFRIEVLPHDNLERLGEISFCGAIGIGIDPPPEWDEGFSLPLVIIDKIPVKKIPGVVYVHSDEKQGMEIAVGRLAESGCRKVGAVLHGAAGQGNVDFRKKGILRALRKFQFPADESLVKICSSELFFEEMGKLLRSGIDGVFCGGGGNFGGIAAYCLSLYGKKIPADIRLISSERHRISRYCIPPQTTISQDYDAIAATAIRRLDGMIRGTLPAARTVLPYHLLVRDSS
jgi:LacI family transcriptional regulator